MSYACPVRHFFSTEISCHHLKIRKFYIHKHAYIHAHTNPSFQIPFKSGKILTDPGPAFLAAFSWRREAPAPSILRRCLPQTPPFPITSHPACFTCYCLDTRGIRVWDPHGQPKVIFQTNYMYTLHWELRGPPEPARGFGRCSSAEQGSAASLLQASLHVRAFRDLRKKSHCFA